MESNLIDALFLYHFFSSCSLLRNTNVGTGTVNGLLC